VEHLEPTLTLPAFAKINLSLRLLGKRPDGYHELDTILQTVSLHDRIKISITENPQLVLSCDDRSLSMDENNLVTRAAKALQDRFAPNRGARIHLEKRIPTQAGLGGGSSDAAMTLIGLSYLWELNPTGEELHRIASDLGADVPFFFFGGAARGTGTGSEIKPLPDLAEKHLLIVKPNRNIATKDAYEALDQRSLTTPDTKTILSSSEAKEFFDTPTWEALQNDFEPVAFQLEPEIERAGAALMNAGARSSLLCGSGSAVFGIFDSEDAQRRAIQAIELETGWRVFPCKTVGRDHYETAMGAAGEITGRLSGQ
jgi:4-diphosphocytidyl-2-C-methyl-D-erythritol kinase